MWLDIQIKVNRFENSFNDGHKYNQGNHDNVSKVRHQTQQLHCVIWFDQEDAWQQVN